MKAHTGFDQEDRTWMYVPCEEQPIRVATRIEIKENSPWKCTDKRLPRVRSKRKPSEVNRSKDEDQKQQKNEHK
jgi:hypothetical protein